MFIAQLMAWASGVGYCYAAPPRCPPAPRAPVQTWAPARASNVTLTLNPGRQTLAPANRARPQKAMMNFAALFLALVTFLAPAVDAGCAATGSKCDFANAYADDCGGITKKSDCWGTYDVVIESKVTTRTEIPITNSGDYCCATSSDDCCKNGSILAVIIIGIIIVLAACGYVPTQCFSLAGSALSRVLRRAARKKTARVTEGAVTMALA